MSEGKQPETPLEAAGVGFMAAKRLRAVWITTAEDLVAQAATDMGRRGLAALLRMKLEEFDEFLGNVKAALGPEKLKALEEKPPEGKGLGAPKPPG